jgi:hypothetical protein
LKRTSSSSPLLHDKVFGTELLDLILLDFENDPNKIQLIIDLINNIRERSLELLTPPSYPRILYYPAAVAASAGGGRRSRSRSVKKKTRRPCRKYYSIKNMKKKRVCQSKRKMISRRRSHKRKN